MDSDLQSNVSVPTSHPVQAVHEQHERHDVCVSESSSESRDSVEVPAKSTTEVEHAQEHSDESCDIEATEVEHAQEHSDGGHDIETTELSVVPVDSGSASETIDAQVAEGSSKWSNSWEVKNEDAPKVPQQFKTVLECELPVGVQDFFQLFFSDESIKFCESFHKKCGDEGFHCTNWAKDQHFGHVRDVSFRHPVKVYFGPKASNCQEVQRYQIYRNNHLIVETSQQMNDIPYGDYFRVEGRWDVVPITNRQTPHCAVRVFMDVAFSKRTVWKGKIEQGTYDECKDVYGTWLAEALRLLLEKGLVDNEAPAGANSVHSSTTRKPLEPVKAKHKRKLESGSAQSQGHVKISKNSSITASSQTIKELGLVHNKHPQGLVSVPEITVPQQSSLGTFASVSQRKLVIVICLMVILFLIQTGIIISLSRSSKLQYIPLNQPRCGEWHETLGSGRPCGRQDVAWLEHASRLLWEEINIAEARLKIMQETLDLLKINMNLVEKFHSNAPSTG